VQPIQTVVSSKILNSQSASLYEEGRRKVEPKLVKRSDGGMWEPSDLTTGSCEMERDLTPERKLLNPSPTGEEWSS